MEFGDGTKMGRKGTVGKPKAREMTIEREEDPFPKIPLHLTVSIPSHL